MKVEKHGNEVVVIIEHLAEKAQLMAHKGLKEWVPVFLDGSSMHFAEIDPVSHDARLCSGQELLDQQEVVFYEI